MPVNALNKVDAQAYADRHEDQLTAAYEDVLRAAGRKAAARFRRLSPLTAAGEPPLDPKQPNWAPPNIDELVDLKQIAAQTARQTRSIRLEAVAAVLGAYGETLSQVSGVQIGEPAFDVTNPAALTLLEGTAGRAGDVAKSVRDDLQKIIGQGYSEGWSVTRTAAQIVEASDQFSKAQARMLARTDLNGIANGGSVIAAKEVGVNFKTWLTASDDLVRPTHQDADGQTVPIDEPFDVGGESADYPGDPALSDAEAANCRCTTLFSDSLGGGEDAGDLAAAGGPDVSSLGMVAVYPEPEEAAAIALPGGHPAEKMHVTLVFLGEADSFDSAEVLAALEDAAAQTPPLAGAVGGVGKFADGGDGAPLLALPDVQGLSALRERVVSALAARGIVSPSEHGWLPHMTLDYVGPDAPLPDESLFGKPVSFSTLSLAIADVRTDVPLGGGQGSSAASAIYEGGAMPEAQITIPLTLSVGNAVAEASKGARGAASLSEAFVSIRPNQAPALAAAPAPTWRAVLCAEGEPTEDGRLLAPGSITWRALPLTLLCQVETAAGHDGAEVCGRIDRIWREGSQIMAEGVFDSGEFGVEAARLVRDETLRGVSVDLAVLDYEYRPAEPAEGEALEIGDAPEAAEPEMFVVLDGVIGAATICAFQAIAQATIEVLTAAGPIRLARVTTPQTSETLAASAVEAEAPLCPPAAWFDDPALAQPTLITVGDDGRVFGHVAPWRGCHTGYAGRCVSPPRSRSGYAAFHTGRIETAEGDLLPIGKLTLASGHAALDLNDAAARAHYDNSSRVVAFVRAGEDEHGIWVAGALRPGVAPAMIQDLLANPLSGDWRNGELVAAHAVPVPGFPILQASAIGEDGEEATALILTSTIGLAASGAEEPDPGPRLRVLAARARGGVEALAELARA